MNGYFIGSEGYIPAKDYSHTLHAHQTWQYAFEKQWLFYSLWGRLLYDPATPDEVFARQFDDKYRGRRGKDLMKAYKLVSKTPLRFASFHKSTWDMTLYSEGFLSPRKPDASSPFVSLAELIRVSALDTSYLSIQDYINTLEKVPAPKKTTPLQLADSLEKDSKAALEMVALLRPEADAYTGALSCELDDIETWAHLGLYFADKLRAGVALKLFESKGDKDQKAAAISLLNNCIRHWDRIIAVTQSHYQEVPYVDGDMFSWKYYKSEVAKDLEMANEYEFQRK